MAKKEQGVDRYSAIAMFLHWLTVLLVIAAFTLGLGGSEQRVYAAANDTQRHIHETLGLTIFFLTLIRLVWRWLDTQPALPSLPRLMVVGARLVQYALYLLLFITPITAVLGAWYQAHPVDLVFGINIGPWIGPDHALGDSIVHIHRLLGDAVIWVAGAHALAAIYHHYLRKEAVLVSMLPQSVAAWFGQVK